MEYKASTGTEPITSYREVEIDRKLYCVTSVHIGQIDLKNALEGLAVRRVMQEALYNTENKC